MVNRNNSSIRILRCRNKFGMTRPPDFSKGREGGFAALPPLLLKSGFCHAELVSASVPQYLPVVTWQRQLPLVALAVAQSRQQLKNAGNAFLFLYRYIFYICLLKIKILGVKKYFLILLFFFGSSVFTFAQMQTWAVAVGGPPIEEGFSITQCKDGDFAIGGTYYSILPQYNTMYAAKVDSNGNLLWANIIGNDTVNFHFPPGSYGNSITETNDGGYVLAGGTAQYGVGNDDVYIVKLNSNGNLQWTKTIGGTGEDDGYSIIQTKDKGYAVAGATNSFGAGSNDVYIIKLDSAGNVSWTKTIGGTGDDQGWSIIQTRDNGYAITGFTNSFGAGNYDVYVIKLDSIGNLKWTKTIGGTHEDQGYSIIQTRDKGYAITGVTYSFNDTDDGDAYIIKLDSTGNLQWTGLIGGTPYDSNAPISENFGQSIIQTTNGEYVVAGTTGSYGSGYYTNSYFVRFDSLGNLKQTQTYGGTQGEFGESIIQTKNGGFAMGGYSSNYRGGYEDVLVMLLDSAGNNCDTTGGGGILHTGGTVSSGGTITSSDSGRVSFGGSITSHGIIVGSCGIITSANTLNPSTNKFTIHPNPCTTMLNIDFPIASNLAEIQIMDMAGRQLQSFDIENPTFNISFDVSALSPGMYFIRIVTENGTEVQKFVKE
jgi:hypothetical protein